MPFTPYSRNLAARGFAGRRIRKVTLHGGFTCPNLDGTKARGGCTYCDNRSFSPVAGARSIPIAEQMRTGMEFQRKRFGADGFIAYFQAYSGTHAPVARLESLYRQALAVPGVVGLSIATRPDCLDAEKIALLESLGRETFLTLELGLQSAHDESLRLVNRAHGFAEFAAAMDLASGRGFDICIHLILGLPGEGLGHFRATALALRPWEYHAIKIHPLHVVRGTALHYQYLAGEYAPLERARYLEGLTDVLERIPDSVGVQRFTGDAMGDLLVAPVWCREKDALRRDLIAEFAIRGTRQGSWCHAHPDPEKAHAAEAV